MNGQIKQILTINTNQWLIAVAIRRGNMNDNPVRKKRAAMEYTTEEKCADGRSTTENNPGTPVPVPTLHPVNEDGDNNTASMASAPVSTVSVVHRL